MSMMCNVFPSPGTFKDKQNVMFPSTCMVCQQVGYHDYIFWECTAVRETYVPKFGQPPVALDLLMTRYGSLTATKASADNGVIVLHWMKLLA